ncbi:30S ribosomal protein S19 [Candidatus Woesearchaeota archaeon]|nr:30S ribosomal protein S19 [Candidatus Woesearchaeota archaeon]
MAKEFTLRGKTLEEIKKMDTQEFTKLLTSRERRAIKRGTTHQQKMLIKAVKENKKTLKTHARDLVILPDMIGKTIKIYSGKDWVPVLIEADMLGHRLGEFALTRKKVTHSAPGVGATRSSAALSVR